MRQAPPAVYERMAKGPPSLVGQTFAALRAAKGQNLAAVGGFHPLTEAVHLAAMPLFGLIGSEHANILLSGTSLQINII